jgi:trans-aconitate methyltransferase
VGKYGERLFVSTEAERQRLASLEVAYDRGSFDTLSQVAIKAHWQCLELGAGAGSVARWLAAQVPDGLVTATDIDTRFLNDLQADNLLVRKHDLVTEEFPEASFDLIHARLLLSHLPDRPSILRKLFKWLKPGGVLVVEGMCWYPVDASENDVYRTGMNAYDKATVKLVGTDSTFMQRLPALMGELGYVDIRVDLHGHVVRGGTPVADMWRRTVAMSRERAVEAGLATHADFDAFEALMHDPTFFGHGPVMAGTWGYRPEAP